MQINGPLDTSSIIGELNTVEGVQSVPRIEFKNKVGGKYANIIYDIPEATKNGIIYPSLDPMIFEIKYPNVDIKMRAIKP